MRRLGDDHALGVDHQPSGGDLWVGEQVPDPIQPGVEPLGGAEDLVAGHREVAHPGDHRPHDLVEAAAQGEDPVHVPGQDLGEREEPDGLRRRSAVHHHDVPAAVIGERLDLGEAEQLVEAGDDRQLFGLDGVGPAQSKTSVR